MGAFYLYQQLEAAEQKAADTETMLEEKEEMLQQQALEEQEAQGKINSLEEEISSFRPKANALKILSPNGREVLCLGQSFPITWEIPVGYDVVNISLESAFFNCLARTFAFTYAWLCRRGFLDYRCRLD